MSNDKSYYVYVYRHPVTMLPFYVGKGKDSRMFKHLYETYENTENRKKYAVIKNLLSHGILPVISRYAKNLDEETAYQIEEMLIQRWGRQGFEKNGLLTNICVGNRPPSSQGRILSEQARHNLSQAKIGEKNPMYGRTGIESPRYGKPGQIGENNGFYGKKHTPESLAVIGQKSRELHTGRKRSEETRAKMRAARKQQVITEETKQKLREANRGKKQSAETIEKRRQTQIGRSRPSKKWIWVITSPNDVIFHVPSLTAFCREHLLNENQMRKVENRSIRTKNGWTVKKLPAG
jgi:hypothetical protein